MLVGVTRVVSSRPFGVIFRARVLEDVLLPKGALLNVRVPRPALVGEPCDGEAWMVEGEISDTPWGPQVQATRATRSLPSGSLVIDFLANHAPGIGPERAKRLWDEFGASLPAVLAEGDLNAIAAIVAPDRPTLGPILAAAVVRAWRDARSEAELVLWLQMRGVSDLAVVRRVAAILGHRAVERLERNPWCLSTLLRWEHIDDLGLRLRRERGASEPEGDPHRLVGAVDAAMAGLIATGSTACREPDLRKAVAARLRTSALAPVVDVAIAAGLRNGAIVRGRDDLCLAPGCATMELSISARLAELAAATTESLDDGHPARLCAVLAPTSNLAGEQLAAVTELLGRPLACLQGGAGVGKTTVARSVCDLWEQAGGIVLLTAMAGKAALRLSTATGRPAFTLFRVLLQLDEREQIDSALGRGECSPVEREALELRRAGLIDLTTTTLVLVDEASMVDLATMHALVRRLPPGARLLLIGDHRQLPPVGFGLIFHALVDDRSITSTLTRVHRQSAESGILPFAAALRERRLIALDEGADQEEGVCRVEAVDAAAIADRIVELSLASRSPDPMVIVPTKDGPAGVRALNRQIQAARLASGACVVISPLGSPFAVGDPVVHTRNDYRRQLYNGSMGKIISIEPHDGTVTAVFDDRQLAFSREQQIDLALGYVLTCHRAQGSEAAEVIVGLTPSRLLDPSWLYTASTRATRRLVLVGSTRTIEETLGRPWAADARLVGFEWATNT